MSKRNKRDKRGEDFIAKRRMIYATTRGSIQGVFNEFFRNLLAFLAIHIKAFTSFSCGLLLMLLMLFFKSRIQLIIEKY